MEHPGMMGPEVESWGCNRVVGMCTTRCGWGRE